MIKKYKHLLIGVMTILLTSISYGQNEEIQQPEELKNLIDSVLSDDFSGIILIAKDGVQEYLHIQGYSDIENEIELDQKNQFVIGSISKQITAVLILKELEKKTLSLDSPIGQYLPDIQQSWSDSVTVHHLLTHTHGIVAKSRPLAFPLGSQFQYSQLGYQLLAEILENINHTTFVDLSSNLFELYGLNNTFHPKRESHHKLAKCYNQNPDGSLKLETASFENYVAAGSFISTAPDLVKWNQLLYSDSLLQDSTFAIMSQYQSTRQHPIFGEIDYGYGLTFKKGESNLQIGALGFAPGFVSSNFYYPESKRTVVILENVVYGLPDFKVIFDDHVTILESLREYH